MQPDDPSITPVSTAAAAMAFSNFLVPLIDHAFLSALRPLQWLSVISWCRSLITPFYLLGRPSRKMVPDDRMLSRFFQRVCNIAQIAARVAPRVSSRSW